MAKKAAFAAASFANLRAAAGEAAGEPLRILLVDIDLDPNQPRKRFDPAALEVLAETIRQKGVLQPVGVYLSEDGRYRLAFGERRYRASKLAGRADISAVIVPEGHRDYASQVIENQQRADLSNSELAGAVQQLHADGKSLKEIAAICNLRDYQVSHFRAVEKLPPFLAERMDQGDMRAIYDLFRAWQKDPAEVEAAMPDADTFLTITEARRVIAAVTGKPTGSIILDREQTPEPQAMEAPLATPTPAPAPLTEPESGDEAPAPAAVREGAAAEEALEPDVQDEPELPAPDLHGANRDPVPAPARASNPAPAQPPAPAPAAQVPVFVMETMEGMQGVLVTHERPEAPGSAFLDVNGDWIEAPFIELRCVNVR
jgi:ParB family chromosome partitioning protein